MWPAKGEPGYRTGNAPMAHPWPLNPAAYQNMSNEQVDWARLAQQWIMMKDTLPQAPPAPQLSVPQQPAPPGATILEEEGGEAPMDISKDDNNDLDNHSGGSNNEPWNGNNWQQQHQQQWNNRPGYWSHKNEGNRFPHPNSPGFEYNRGYGGPPAFDGMPPGPPQMAPFLRPRHQWEGKNMKIDRRFQNAAQNIPPVIEEDPAPVIDAAKRRTLPPWIREGLEKMEREKQKREEREKAELEREEANRRRLQEEQLVLSELDGDKSGIPRKSKFESDSDAESEGKEDEQEVLETREVVKQPVIEAPPRPRRRFHDGPPPDSKASSWLEKPVVSREDLMLKVRRTMTEVLLDVTNSEIDSVVEETLRKALNKGLAMYGSGSDGSSSESEDDDDRDVIRSASNRGHDSGDDSDGDIKELIRRRQQDFVAREKEIEAAVAEAEEKEQRAAANHAKPVAESVASAKDLSNSGQTVRQVETLKEQSHADESNGRSGAKVEKTERKHRSPSRSSSSSSSSSDSSRSSRHRKRKKEKRNRNRSKDRKKDRKRRRSSSSSRRSKSPRRRNSSRDRERKRRGSRDRSRSRNRRRRSRSSESHRKSHRRSRSRSDSSRRRRRRRSTSSSSSSDRKGRKRR